MKKTLIWLSLFAIAMGLLEAAVVIYIRELYFPGGESIFPLKTLPDYLAIVELSREAATILMLVGVGYLAGKNAWSRFGFFLMAFGIWDIFYYIFLYLFISWPQTLTDWDILFLIPLPWVGPVLAPCLVAALMTALGILMAFYEHNARLLRFHWQETMAYLLGCLIILFSFMQEPFMLLYREGFNWNGLEGLETYIPVYYNWWIFLTGFTLLLFGFTRYYLRLRQSNQLVI